jgi:pilus assembly protein CpaB
MNVKSFVPLIAGLCIGGLALKIGISTLQRARGSTSATVELWAPAGDIPRGTLITADMLKSMQFPKDLVPLGAVREKDKLLGRVPHVDAPAGLPILDPMLLPPGSPAGVHVPPGLRAVAVKVDEGSGVDFHLEPGSRVDVIGYFQTQDSGKRETIARTLIEDVEVAAVGARISAVATEGEGRGSSNRPARAVTLLVKPGNVPILHLAEQRGKIKLSMRGTDDTEEVGRSRAVSDSELLGQTPEPAAANEEEKEQPGPMTTWLNKFFARSPGQDEAAGVETARPEPPAAPPPPADPPWVVQVYRGNQVETVQFLSRDSRERVQGRLDPNRTRASLPSNAKVGMASHQHTPVVAPAAPVQATSAGDREKPGAELNVNTESEANAQDQVPQEPKE